MAIRGDTPYIEYHQLLLLAEGEGDYGEGVTLSVLDDFVHQTKVTFLVDCQSGKEAEADPDACELRNEVMAVTGLDADSTTEKIDAYFSELLQMAADY